MSGEVLWSELINSTFQCQCTNIDDFYGRLTVIDITNNTTILDKQLVLKQPFAYDQWRNFCMNAINNY